jgi:hypothetical protein
MKNHMIKRFPVMTLVLFVGLIFLSVDVFTATQVRETIMIANRYKKYEKGPVTLSHQKHAEDYKVACNECHHEYKDGKNVWNEMMGVKRCRECHDAGKKQGNADILNLAYHKQCHTCHKELKAKEAPWQKCEGCHAEKK